MERTHKHHVKYKLTRKAPARERLKRFWCAYKPLVMLVAGVLLIMTYIPCRIDAAHHRFSSAIGGEVFILLGGVVALIAACREVE